MCEAADVRTLPGLHDSVALVASVLPVTGVGYVTASAMRAIPLIGPILGFATFPALYAAVTWALGRTFAWHFSRGGTLDNIVSDETKERFRSEFESAKSSAGKAKGSSGAKQARQQPAAS